MNLRGMMLTSGNERWKSVASRVYGRGVHRQADGRLAACAHITPWANWVQVIDAKYVGSWELPVLGAVTASTAVLIRPDGYVAWVGDRTHQRLHDALATWFGPPTAA